MIDRARIKALTHTKRVFAHQLFEHRPRPASLAPANDRMLDPGILETVPEMEQATAHVLDNVVVGVRNVTKLVQRVS